LKKVLLLSLMVILTLAGCSKPAKTGAGGANAEAVGPFDASFKAFQSAFEAKDYGQALAGLRTLLGGIVARPGEPQVRQGRDQ
jgi:hypothetical protein